MIYYLNTNRLPVLKIENDLFIIQTCNIGASLLTTITNMYIFSHAD